MSDNYVPVKGFSGLVRNTENNAIINTNRTEIEQARKRKALKRKQKQEQQELEREVETIKDDVSEIKNMLKMLLSKTDK